MKILVIDDEGIIRTLARQILERDGHYVVVAESGYEGLKLFSNLYEEIAIILVDLRMEGLSGIETIRRVREIRPDVPCIISSGDGAQRDDIPEDLNHNIWFLKKPYRPGELSGIVNTALVGK